MSLRDRPDRRLTPDDTVTNGEGPDSKPSPRGLSAGPMDTGTRGLRMIQHDRRFTPNDHGDMPEEVLITIRKLNDSDGSEVRRHGRGVEADLFGAKPGPNPPYMSLACRALFAVDDKLVSAGSAVTGASHGNLVRWTQNLARGKRSGDAGEFDAATGWSAGAVASGFAEVIGEVAANKFYAAESNGLLWIAGSVPTGAYHRRAIQAVDPTTLEGQFITEMTDIPNQAGVDAHWWREIAPTPTGLLTHRAGALPDYVGQAGSGIGTWTVAGGIIESWDTDGNLLHSLAWHNRRVLPLLKAGVGVEVGANTHEVWISDVALGRDGRAYLVVLRGDDVPLSDRDNFPRLYTTDTALAVVNSVQLHTGTYFPSRGWLGLTGDSSDGGSENNIRNWRFRILVDSTAVYVVTQTKPGVGPPPSPNFGTVFGSTRSGVIFQFDLSGNLTSTYKIRGSASSACLLDDAGNLFYSFNYTPAAPPFTRLVKLTNGVEQWETNAVIPINSNRVITTGGYHYFAGGTSGQEVAKIDAATGALVWTGRHDAPLFDVLKRGDFVYVVGAGSSYEP